MASRVVSCTGLSELYAPEDVTPLADVIFVHGLAGDPKDTWTFSPATDDREVFWPLDLLPKDCPDVRILTWGYDVKIANKYRAADKNNIFSHARTLLYTLGRNRRLGQMTIFVAHSLGGIIVKEMLRRSDLSEEELCKDIIRSTAGIIFLSTPHHGSQFASLAEVVRFAANVIGMDTNSKILGALANGPELEICGESFIDLWRKYDFSVKTFQESRAMAGVRIGPANKLVVPHASSSLNDSREHAEVIDGNHITMCKFSGADSQGYKSLSGEIKARVRVIAKRLGEDEKACLQSLAFVSMDTRYRNIQPALHRTCLWVYKNEQFRSWLSRDNVHEYHGLLRVKGKPGAGKSTLMKATAQNLGASESVPGRIIVMYFFDRHGDKLQKSLLGLFRSMLHQILQKNRAMLQELVRIYKEKKDTKADKWEWTKEELQEFLFSRMKTLPTVRFDLFIDALDECGETQARQIFGLFSELASSAVSNKANVNICFSTRHYPNITMGTCPEVVIEDENHGDIYDYVSSTLSIPQGPEESILRTGIANQITRRSSGIFLWAVFAVDMVCTDQNQGISFDNTNQKLQHLPADLDDMFTHLLKNMNPEDVKEAILLWQWVLLARWPLYLSELRQAISFSRNTGERAYLSLGEWKKKEAMQGLDYGMFMKKVLGLSKGLMEVIVHIQSTQKEDNTIKADMDQAAPGKPVVDQRPGSLGSGNQNIDQTVIEHHDQVSSFSNTSIFGGLTPTGDVNMSISNTQPNPREREWQLFLHGLTLMFGPAAKDWAKRLSHYPAPLHIRYSQHTWGLNYKPDVLARSRVQIIHESVREFFSDKAFQLLDPSTGSEAIAKGHYVLSKACYTYLCIDELRSLPARFEDPCWSNAGWGKRLSSLADEFSLDAADLSLVPYALKYFRHHALQADSGGIPLDFLDSRTLPHILNLICYRCILPKKHITILDFACQEGLFCTAEYLARHSRRTDADDASLQTCLHAVLLCAAKGRTDKEIADIIPVLLRYGADVNAYYDNLTPLHRAAEMNLTLTATRLLEFRPKGANVNAINDRLLAPIHSAVLAHVREGSLRTATDRFSEMYEVLISHGADVTMEAKGMLWGHFSALSLAIGNLTAVEVHRFVQALPQAKLSKNHAAFLLNLTIKERRFDYTKLLLDSQAFRGALYVEVCESAINDLQKLLHKPRSNISLEVAADVGCVVDSAKLSELEIQRYSKSLEDCREEAAHAGRTDRPHWLFKALPEFGWVAVTILSIGLVTQRVLNTFRLSTCPRAILISFLSILLTLLFHTFTSQIISKTQPTTRHFRTMFYLMLAWSILEGYALTYELPRLIYDTLWFRILWIFLTFWLWTPFVLTIFALVIFLSYGK